MVENTSWQLVKSRVYHFYRKGRVVNQLQESSDHTAVEYGNQLLAQQHCEGGRCTSTPLTVDQQQTVLHRASQYPSQQPVVYTPYGHSPQYPGWFGFNGERPDLVMSNYLLGNGRRGFNPVLMRFNSPDVMSPLGPGGLNAYSYCQQDPVNYQDPSGNFRVGRYISSLFGRVVGSRRYKAPKKGIFPSIHTDVTPVLVAPIRPFGQKNGPGKVFSRTHNEDQVSMNVTRGRTEMAGYDFLGYHGSSEEHKLSLEAGLDIKYNTMQQYGPGFYYSPNLETSMGFARSEGVNQGYVYGVYGKSSKLKGRINNYLGGDYRVVREEGFGDVLVRDFIQYPVHQSALEIRS